MYFRAHFSPPPEPTFTLCEPHIRALRPTNHILDIYNAMYTFTYKVVYIRKITSLIFFCQTRKQWSGEWCVFAYMCVHPCLPMCMYACVHVCERDRGQTQVTSLPKETRLVSHQAPEISTSQAP